MNPELYEQLLSFLILMDGKEYIAEVKRAQRQYQRMRGELNAYHNIGLPTINVYYDKPKEGL